MSLKRLQDLYEDVERLRKHDLKGPLISIIYCMRLLSGGGNITKEQLDIVSRAEKLGCRMLDMINLSLVLYKMETGTYRPEPKPVDLIPVTRDVLEELENLIRFKRISIETALPDGPVREDSRFVVYGEELLYRSMLANLVRNAVEASPKDSLVTIDLFILDKEAGVSIHNRGAVPREIRDKLFKKYVTCGKKEGNGLGAYSSRLIARACGGDVTCDTDEERGTTMTVRLPGQACSGMEFKAQGAFHSKGPLPSARPLQWA